MLIGCYRPHFMSILLVVQLVQRFTIDVQRLILNLNLLAFTQHSKKCEPTFPSCLAGRENTETGSVVAQERLFGCRYGSSLSSIKPKGQVWKLYRQSRYTFTCSCMCLVLYVCFMLCYKLRTM